MCMETTVIQARAPKVCKELREIFEDAAVTIGVFSGGRIILNGEGSTRSLSIDFDRLPSARTRQRLKNYGLRKMYRREVYSCYYDGRSPKSIYSLVFAQLVTDAVMLEPEAVAIINQFTQAHFKKYNVGSAKSRLLGLLTEWSLAYFSRR